MTCLRPTTLAHGILDIVALSSEKEVRWFSAQFVVAIVKDTQFLWDWSEVLLPNEPGCSRRASNEARLLGASVADEAAHGA